MGRHRGLGMVGGLGLGAGLMYLLDPDAGNRRRAAIHDKLTHSVHKTGDALETTWRDAGHRARGLLAEARAAVRGGQVPDAVLVERVRARLGRAVSHPRSIEASADRGRVTLRGHVLAREVEGLLDAVGRVRGASAVENRLTVHERAEGVPGLQGMTALAGERSAWMQTNWSPTARAMAGLSGAALALYAMQRRGILGAALGAAGIGLVARGLTDLEMKRLLGIGAGRRAVDLQKTLTIDAPVESVFEIWSRPESFPRFMSHVREVRDQGAGLSRWVVDGPGGISVEWDAEIVASVPNKRLSWRTRPGSPVQHAGRVRFDPNPDGTTRVEVRISYNPPAGAVGHTLAELFGFDPRSTMDEDLVRMKTFIETGMPPHDAAERPGARFGTVL